MWKRRSTDVPAVLRLEPNDGLEALRSTCLCVDNDLMSLVTHQPPPQEVEQVRAHLMQHVACSMKYSQVTKSSNCVTTNLI